MGGRTQSRNVSTGAFRIKQKKIPAGHFLENYIQTPPPLPLKIANVLKKRMQKQISEFFRLTIFCYYFRFLGLLRLRFLTKNLVLLRF